VGLAANTWAANAAYLVGSQVYVVFQFVDRDGKDVGNPITTPVGVVQSASRKNLVSLSAILQFLAS
jgi:hypothetical protein